MNDVTPLDLRIEALLADAQYDDHPLRGALNELYGEFRSQLHLIERVTHVSDLYQHMAREQNQSLLERYRRQLKKLEKIARISDRYQAVMRDLNEALKDASNHDALTGLANRRMLMDALRTESNRLLRQGRPMTLVLADIDHFKQINDAYGHERGDAVLVDIARAMASSVREYDLCGRWGGEEFLIVMPETGLPEALEAVERMRRAIAALHVVAGEHNVTASFGVAEHLPGDHLSATISRADTALYAAKKLGRNRCEVAPAGSQPASPAAD
ncbi:diguanylate cyclase (GGDEF) domain-containing protein [Andreprevotia lacus DSM 23236]|jgi:diguanylate cyclase (GGDEF)-like protein|uniref:diguanylate cyclase n=1 Tax=Andreprevotia lacus DSM 23236 TaxID=1121001 RepID=A0A1W1X5H1_9NEIS|nr:biofilm regulation diguanylate cyclase SiaD [Andreprevotia lacus]SMC19162.1 diguanylate cyclase (GGDEF) domain-containing protein [Andreprevotia lacus DSM 23236]